MDTTLSGKLGSLASLLQEFGFWVRVFISSRVGCEGVLCASIPVQWGYVTLKVTKPQVLHRFSCPYMHCTTLASDVKDVLGTPVRAKVVRLAGSPWIYSHYATSCFLLPLFLRIHAGG